jgi:hypothetical protein
MASVVMGIGTAIGSAGILSTVSTVLSIGSALSAIGAGRATQNRKNEEAAHADLEAEEIKLAGGEARRDLSLEYEKLRAEQTSVQLANGLDLGVGTPVNIGQATKREATRRQDITRENVNRRTRMARLRSRGLVSEGKTAFTSGLLNAGGIVMDQAKLTG